MTKRIRNLTIAALMLALCMVLPFITGHVPAIGNMLSPMHFPVFVAGFVCGPYYAMVVGFIAPLLRFALFQMPPILPNGLSMAFELATYGLVTGLLFNKLEKNKMNIYVTMLISMLAGRIVWGLARYLIAKAVGASFTMTLFMAGAFTNAIPGIIAQLILIPLLIMALQKAKIIH